jgi:hypothetical protein
MRQQLLRQISGTALAIMLTLTFTQILVSAQESQDGQDNQLQSAEGSHDEQRSEKSRQSSANARKIEGVWDAQVTLRDCQTGHTIATDRSMLMFIRGGSLMATDIFPTQHGPGLGRWRYIGGRRYDSPFRFFRFNPDGTFAGFLRATRNITLSRGGDEFTSTISSAEFFDPNDNLIGNICGTETAKRVE